MWQAFVPTLYLVSLTVHFLTRSGLVSVLGPSILGSVTPSKCPFPSLVSAIGILTLPFSVSPVQG